MLNKLFGGKKRNSAAKGRTNPSPSRHGRPKYGSFCMPERSDNPPLGHHGPLKSVSFSMPERSDNSPLGHHGPAKSVSFSMPERSDNPPLGHYGPAKSVSFSMPERSGNPLLGRHGPPRSVSFSMPERSNNPPLGHHGPPKSASFSMPERSDNNHPRGHHTSDKSTLFTSGRSSAALKIIHAGGKAEYYYMATPAYRILDKYPSFILAKPDVFKKPWDSVVHKDEILIPGQKYYVVPQCTLKKLRKRIKKSSQDSSKSQYTSIIKNKSSSDKNKARDNHHVSFFGIDCKQDSSCSVLLEINKENEEVNHEKILNDPQRNRTSRNVITWQPTLTVINEK
ncbi:hypothetical protein P3S67_008076 [Capsicum chacoense]